ncbi:Rqc2 family fibronectin-binding protein [Helcococcus sueciensis]|uniref:Rqc2 family fibronectin-binding protein n=1 Tax=Helcococcus sueciensis TaxID=241555 RepID=UPI00041ACA79|nr:NFACT RNA binding domain-containing protein [Helcococcus sueciensis]
MALDGIVLKSLVKEFNEKLINGHIQKIYQINEHILILNIYNKENYKLLISSNPQNARIHLTDFKYDNPTTPPQFAMILRKHILNSTIKEIKQIGMDRSLEIVISTKDELGLDTVRRLMIDIMGKYSNIVLTNENYKVIESIKRISHEMSSVRAVYPGTQFSKLEDNKINILKNTPNLQDLEIPETYKIKKVFYMLFQGFGPQIGDEIAFRANIDFSRSYGTLNSEEKENLNQVFQSVVSEIKSNKFEPHLYFDKEKSIDFYSMKLLSKGDNYKTYDSISEVLDIYYSQNVNDNSLNQVKSNLVKTIEQKISHNVTKLDNLNKDFDESKKYEVYRIEGDLLSTVAYKIKKGQRNIEVYNYYDDTMININLDNRKSAWENIELKYKKSKKLYKSYNILLESIPNLEEEISYLRNIISQIYLAENHNEVSEIKEELIDQKFIKKPSKSKKKKEEKSSPHKYITDNNNIIYVGKNNKQNEYLTLREANPNDYFFHIKDLPGSHVILKNNQKIEDYEIEIAAYLAANFSKNSSDRYIDVDYTEKKNVNKAKGSKPGMVYYTNYTTIRVDLENTPKNFKKM